MAHCLNLSALSEEEVITLHEEVKTELRVRCLASTAVIYRVQGPEFSFLYSTDSVEKLYDWLSNNTNLSRLLSAPLPNESDVGNCFAVGMSRMDYQEWVSNPLFNPDPAE